MLILLSCAKTMVIQRDIKVPFTTEPRYRENAIEIISQMEGFSVEELMSLLKVNSQIAQENYLRYKVFEKSEKTPAINTYDGIVFKYIDPANFSEEDFKYAQEHLRIVSFAYGLLKPLDEISLYRLEGAVALPKAEKSVFNYWKDKLTDELIDAVKSAGGILCNLASREMQNMFDWKRVMKEVKVISPEFKMWKDGKLKTIVIYTKMARGISTREIIKRRIEDVETLEKLFNEVMEIG